MVVFLASLVEAVEALTIVLLIAGSRACRAFNAGKTIELANRFAERAFLDPEGHGAVAVG